MSYTITSHLIGTTDWYKQAVLDVVPKAYLDQEGFGNKIASIWARENRGSYSYFGGSSERIQAHWAKVLRKETKGIFIPKDIVGGKLL